MSHMSTLITNLIRTPVRMCTVSDQSTSMPKCCVYMFDIVYTAFSCEGELNVSSFLENFLKGRGSRDN